MSAVGPLEVHSDHLGLADVDRGSMEFWKPRGDLYCADCGWHPRPTDLARITMAKSVCRAPDWDDTPRMPRPDADLWRSAPAANSFLLCEVLHRIRTHLALDKDAPMGSGGPANG